MKNTILILAIAFLFSCKKEDIQIHTTCILDMEAYDFSYGIHYDRPEDYLIPGDQSDLDDTYFEEIKNTLGTPEHTLAGIQSVCQWFMQNFTFYNEAGRMIGKKTVDELYETKSFYGCHSAALIISSILREFGFPTVMIETASIVWAYKYIDGTDEGFVGHVMTEVYVSDQWILLDNDGTCVEAYECMDPFISMRNRTYLYYKQGVFAYAKGLDIWDYGVRSESDTHEKMKEFAKNIVCFEDLFDSKNYSWRN